MRRVLRLIVTARVQIDIDDDEEEKEGVQVDAKQRDGRYLLVSGNSECMLSKHLRWDLNLASY